MHAFGIIGLGYWGPNHARVIQALPGAKLSWCCDLRLDNLDKVKSQYPSTQITQDYRDVLADSSVSAVVIATAARTHYGIAKDALMAGKHVLVEKPMTYLAADSKKLIKLAREQGRVLMVGHIFMFNPGVRKLKEHIESGELGQPRYFYATRTALGPLRSDVNAMWDLALHDVSIFLYLFGAKAIEISARGEYYLQKGIEDVVFLNLRFCDGSGPQASIYSTWLDPVKSRRLTIIGDKQTVVFDDVSPKEKLIIYKHGTTSLKNHIAKGITKVTVNDEDIMAPQIENREPLREAVTHFLKCIEDNQEPLTNAEDGYRVVAVMEAAQESLKNGGQSVRVDFQKRT